MSHRFVDGVDCYGDLSPGKSEVKAKVLAIDEGKGSVFTPHGTLLPVSSDWREVALQAMSLWDDNAEEVVELWVV